MLGIWRTATVVALMFFVVPVLAVGLAAELVVEGGSLSVYSYPVRPGDIVPIEGGEDHDGGELESGVEGDADAYDGSWPVGEQPLGPAPALPEATPTPEPSPEPTPGGTPEPAAGPEPAPGPAPEVTPEATPEPTQEPAPEPTPQPTPEPTPEPTPQPTQGPAPTPEPTPAG